jgi:hypothetical protein
MRKMCSLCDRTTKTHRISAVGICSTCEVGIIYWRKKTASQIVKRARQLVSLQNRMELILGNVQSHVRRKHSRRRAA